MRPGPSIRVKHLSSLAPHQATSTSTPSLSSPRPRHGHLKRDSVDSRGPEPVCACCWRCLWCSAAGALGTRGLWRRRGGQGEQEWIRRQWRCGTVRAWSVCAAACLFVFPCMVRANRHHVSNKIFNGPRLLGCHGALAWRMAAAWLSYQHSCWTGGPSWYTGRRSRQAMRLRPELPRPGRLQTGPATRRSRTNTSSVMARDDFLPRRSAGGAAHTWWRLAWGPLVGGGPHRCQRTCLLCVQKKKLACKKKRSQVMDN